MNSPRRSGSAWSVRAVLAAALLLALTLTGCVSVPSAGPVERVEGQPPQCANCVNVDVAPPSAGQQPKQIVEGFLRAMSNFQPNYAVARQFLSRTAVEKWTPEAGVTIYSGSPEANGNAVKLTGRLLGSLGADRSLTARDQALQIDFGLVQESGQWRISTPPQGLLVADYAFENFYQSYNLYFVSANSLVPDPIYLPNLRNQAATASVLVRSLIGGPSAWIKPAVSTALPASTALSVDAVTISDGVAEIPLNDPVLSLNDAQRTQMAAQVVYTLKPLGIRGVKFSVNQQPVAIPGGDPDTFVVDVESTFGDLDPIPSLTTDQLYAARAGGVVRTDPGTSEAPEAVPGPLGGGTYAVDSLAVSVSDTDIAAVTDGGTRLRRGPTGGNGVVTLVDDATGLLRPQFTRYNELWAVGNRGGRQRLWVFNGDNRAEVDLSALGTGTITAFRVSPDGSRLAALRTVGGRTELGLARILRTDKITVDGWRALNVTRSDVPRLSVLRDVSWVNATNLIVLAGTSADAPLTPFRVSQDAFSITAEGEATTWDAVGIAVSLRTQTTVVLTSDGQTWRNGGSQWISLIDKVRAVCYPG